METQEKTFKSKVVSWLPVIFFMITATYIRFVANTSGNYLLIGGDGPYYPLQVRNIIEHYHLALPDMPLLFIVEALVAKILILFHVASYNECILIAIKSVDIFLPPLAAIPVFLISKELITDKINVKFLNYIVVGFSVLNMTTTLFFSSGLQKNSLAVVWIFFYLYFIIKLIKYEQKKDLYYALLILLLCVLTHFGSFSILVFLSILIGLFWLLYNKHLLRTYNFKKIIIGLTVLITFFLIIAYFDPNRFKRLLFIPLKVFEFPVLLLMFEGFDITSFFNPLHLVIIIPLTLIALIIVIVNRKTLDKNIKILSYALITASFFLTFPLIGLEWANRLYVMGYIPIVVLYLIIFNKIQIKWVKFFPAFIFVLLISLSVFLPHTNQDCITKEAYTEFTQIQHKVKFTGKSVIIGRQDLRLLGSWEFKTKSVANYLFTKKDFKKYDSVYVIRQIKGINFSKNRFRGEAKMPDNSVKVYSGEYFELYKLNNSEGWKGGKGKSSRARGKIITINKDNLVLKNDQTGLIIIVELTKKPTLHLLNNNINLKPNMNIEIWGVGKPFSLNVIAEYITEQRELN